MKKTRMLALTLIGSLALGAASAQTTLKIASISPLSGGQI